MPELTQKTAVRVANQVFEDHGMKYPWSFVAVPSGQDHELKLRLIQVEADVELAAMVSYARPPHAFYAECSRALSGLVSVLRGTIQTQHRSNLRDERAMKGIGT